VLMELAGFGSDQRKARMILVLRERIEHYQSSRGTDKSELLIGFPAPA
jgi:hypothetical protein